MVITMAHRNRWFTELNSMMCGFSSSLTVSTSKYPKGRTEPEAREGPIPNMGNRHEDYGVKHIFRVQTEGLGYHEPWLSHLSLAFSTNLAK